MKFTKQQAEAIQSDQPGNILVSASAGSGKTRVLVERVIRKIKHFVGIDELLIVTFTKAAAKEMKDRIRIALQEAINDPENKENVKLQRHLIRQIRKLPVADISTLDAFCQRIVQNYYYVINLDPEFRILTDRTEVQLLRDQVWENLREDLYANDDHNRFLQLVDNFSDDRSDDGLTELVDQLYDYANVNQDPDAWLNELPEQYQVGDSLTKSPIYLRDIKPVIIDRLEQMILKYRSALEYARHAKDDVEKEAEYYQSGIEQVQSVLDHLDQLSWNQLQARFSENPTDGSFPRGKGADHVAMKQFNDDAKKIWNKQINEDYFQLDEATNVDVIRKSHALIETLVKVVEQFSHAYQQLKQQRHGMEFIDIEHVAYDILSHAQRSEEVRENLQKQYQEIMVDEYQDNNRLQDAILQAVARKNGHGEANNMFMVGDVKQSIYRFRLGDPSIFMGRQRNYQDDANDNLNIDLADNFRSAQNIDRFVNLIFTQIMDREVGEIDYQGPAKLKFGAKYYPDTLSAKVEMMLYDNGQKDDDETVNEQFQVSDAAHGQMELVANQIDRMIKEHAQIYDRDQQQMRDVRYSDIAILSSTRSQNLVLSDVFNQHQIPVTISGNNSYFKTTEIQIMMALLRIIDNPYQDIPLVAVLRSPIVGLDENQLAYIRINRNTGDYYHAVQSFMQNYANLTKEADFGEIVYRKLERFLDQLNDFRDYAHHHELVDLIWYIYQTTGFLDYVGGMPAGKQRQVNLHALYQRAAEYEKTSFKGLFQFVRFIERMQKHDQDLAEPVEIVDDNTIQVMTIHGSKGLEFPVVFLIDIQRQFNMQETKQRFVLNDKLGLGIDYIDQAHREKMPTLQKRVVLDQIKAENQAEEMRKLYVALTRAEQQLYLVGIAKPRGKNATGQDQLLSQWSPARFSPNLVLDAALRNEGHSALDWMGMALYRHPAFVAQFDDDQSSTLLADDQTKFEMHFYGPAEVATTDSSGDEEVSQQWMAKTVAEKPDVSKIVDVDQIKQVMNFQYQYQVATHTTAYQAVSEVKRLFDDPDATDMGLLAGDQDQMKQSNRYVSTRFAQPKFLQTVMRPSPAEIGTATHLVLQKIDVTEPPTEEKVQQLIQRLVDQRIMTSEVARYVNIDSILSFFDSEVGKEILTHPDRLHREVPFSLLLSASMIFKDFAQDADERILIHGIIDGYLILDDRVILFDYKTDHLGGRNLDEQIERVIDKYRGQVNLYGIALSKILNRPIQNRYLYLLSINRLVRLTN